MGEAKDSITSSEFVRWARRFRDEYNEPSRDNWYTAQLTFNVNLLGWLVSNLFNKHPKPYTKQVSDFLMTFKFGTKEKPDPRMTDSREGIVGEDGRRIPYRSDDVTTATKPATKHIVMAAIGLNPDGTQMQKKGKVKVETREPPADKPKTPPPPLKYAPKKE